MVILDPELFDLTHDLILEIDTHGRVRAINLPACRALQGTRDELTGELFMNLVSHDDRDEYRACLETTARNVSVKGSHLTLLTRAGQSLRVEASFYPRGEGGEKSIYAFFRSLTEQQHVRAALRESERQLRRVLSAVPDLLMVLDSRGHYREIYTAEFAMLAKSPAELIGKPIHEFHSEEEAAFGMQTIREVIERQQPIDIEYSRTAANETHWFSARVVPFGTESDPCVLWVARDITNLRQARQKLQEDQTLLRSLLELETKAREVIAYEIHDGFVQYAVGTQMWLQNVTGQLDSLPEETAMAIKISVESIQQAVEEARAMIRDLRPVVVGEEGIANGLQQLIEVMQKKTNIPIHFACDHEPPQLLPLLEGQVFRIVQESLNNVIRHSDASEAVVRLGGHRGEIEITVADDGCGFDPQQVATDRYGLEGIQQRANVFGGIAQVATGLGSGTTIRVRLPMIFPES